MLSVHFLWKRRTPLASYAFPSLIALVLQKKSVTVLSTLVLKTKQKQMHTAKMINGSSINRYLQQCSKC